MTFRAGIERARAALQDVGPGIAIAATGVGAGDMVAAAVAGAKLGTAVLWAAALGALLKFALNEGIARWQLGTGTTLLEGWMQKLPRVVSIYFLVYLVLWSFFVAGALISACGLAAFALTGSLSVAKWGILHSLAAAALVYFGRYRLFERIMKWLIALMFVVILISAWLVRPDLATILRGLLVPGLPPDAVYFVLGVVGGVGGSVTLLSYGYWIRERGWSDGTHQARVRTDLGVAYFLTGLFGVAVMVIAAGVAPELITGNRMALAVADRLEVMVGPLGRWSFLLGFWGAVFSSMIGVWQGVPYLFADFWQLRRNERPQAVRTDSAAYRGYLLYLALPPMLLLLVQRPVWIIVLYAAMGALFMPFLAATLLFLNNRREWVQSLRNSLWMNLLLGLSLLLFAYLGWQKLASSW